MSGIEIAGLVLGAIPICLTVLKKFDEATDKVQRYRKWRFEVETYQRSLIGLQYQLKHSLTILCRLADLEDPDFDQVRRDSGASLFNDDDKTQQLHQFYGPVWESVESDIIRLRTLVKAVCKKLGLGDSFKMQDLSQAWIRSSSIPTAFAAFRERLTYTLSSSELRKLFPEIDARQNAIRGTIADIEALNRVKPRKSKSQDTSLHDAREKASILHVAVKAATVCTEHAHAMKLQLDSELRDFITQQQHHSFRICLSSTLSRQFVFAEVSIAQAGTKSASLALPNGASPVHIKDICPIIRQPHSKLDWLGLHIDREQGAQMKGIYYASATTLKARDIPPAPRVLVSLSSVLDQPPQWKHSILRFMDKDRRLLAIRVASYALMLDQAGWKTEQWSEKNIEFLLGDCDGASRPVDYTRAFVPHAADCTDSASSPCSQALNGSNKSCHLFRTLAALLIQLCLGENVSRSSVQSAISQVALNEYEEFILIQRLKHERDADISSGYEEALRFCLTSSMDRRTNLARGATLGSTIESIVLPLMKEYNAMYPGAAIA